MISRNREKGPLLGLLKSVKTGKEEERKEGGNKVLDGPHGRQGG